MFIISLNYLATLEQVEKHLKAHRQFLQNQYDRGIFIASGPKSPRTGGVIIASHCDRAQLEQLLHADPFYQHGIADFTITEFTPVMHNENFAAIAKADAPHWPVA